MASNSYDTVKSVLDAIGLSEALPDFQREELDDSIFVANSDITAEDLAQAGLDEPQSNAFIAEFRAHLLREASTAPQSESSGSSDTDEPDIPDPKPSCKDMGITWRYQSDDGLAFSEFDESVSSLLESALVGGQTLVRLVEKNWSFDLVAMTQTNERTSSKRAIERLQLGVTAAQGSPSLSAPSLPPHPRFGRPIRDIGNSSEFQTQRISSSIELLDMQVDPDAILPTILQQHSPAPEPKRTPPPLPPPRRISVGSVGSIVEAPSGQMCISVKFSVVYDTECAVCIGSDASSRALKTRTVLLVQGSNLHLDAILCLCQPSPEAREHCLRKHPCVNLACSTISNLKSDRSDNTKMYQYCLSVNRCDTANASIQQSLDDSVDMFSRQIIYVCFDEPKPHEVFIDAVKRTCASAAQVMNYIDSLPLAPKRASGAFGSKGFSLLRGIADIGTTMLASGGAAVTKIIGAAPAAEPSRDDLHLSGEAFRVIVEVLKSALRDREASSVHVSQMCNKEEVIRALSPEYMNHLDQLCDVYGLEQDGYFFCKNPTRLSWLQVLPLTLVQSLEPVQCAKLKALKLPKSLIRDSLAKMACGYLDGVFVDSRPLSVTNAELTKLDLCSGGLGSHHLQPLKSTWHQGLISTATLHCIPLAFVDLRSLATGGDIPEDCQPGWLNWNVRYGQCIGTCYREFTSLSQSRQLFNAYMSVLPDHNGVPRVIMRHAVPNSADRIKMIGAALKSCKIPIKRVRMLSLLTRHGFNEEETMFVEQQRCFETELAGNSDWNQSDFVSICLQANANTKFNWANQGETHNAVCNALAWLKYSSWIIKDLHAWTESSGDLDELLDVQGSRSVLLSSMKKMEDESKLAMSLCESPAQVVLRGSISTHFTRLGWFNPDKPGPFNSIRNVNLQISRLLASLKPIAVALYKALAAASQDHLESLKERVSKFESLCHAMNIFNRLVSSQYPSGKENEVLPRTSELALVAALDRMLGVSSLMNCKSGCDRAGLAHGIAMAVESLYLSHSSASVTCALLELESCFAAVDEKIVRPSDYYSVLQEFMVQSVVFDIGNRSQGDSSKKSQNPGILVTDAQGSVVSPQQNDLFMPLSPETSASLTLGTNLRNRAQMICLCCELRNMFLKHVMCIGWKVNIHSCGVPGLKYNIKVSDSKSGSSISGKIKSVGKDISTNPHFGVFLPPVALVGDPMQSHVLVRLQVNQVVTEEFGAFVNGCSSFRGS